MQPRAVQRPMPQGLAPWGWRLAVAALVGLVAGVAWRGVADELQGSRVQARWLTDLSAQLNFSVQPGPSEAIRFPDEGPYDLRLGYHGLPMLVERLSARGFEVQAQARWSPKLMELHDRGLFTVYPEKSQAGLQVNDCRGDLLAASRHPRHGYADVQAVPRVLADSLLFVENRELLDDTRPHLNPAIEWARLGKAAIEHAWRSVDAGRSAAGGSTLATQIEKYRHSPHGRTDSVGEKLRQMASASLRAYLGGEHTLARRQQILVDYLNTVPLSAQLGFGEVHGLGDGLWAWYGRDFDEVNRLLSALVSGEVPRAPPAARDARAFREVLLREQALAYKQALSLIVAQRRPSHYLAERAPSLRNLTDSHLRLLTQAGIIPEALRDAALPLPLHLLPQQTVQAEGSFIERKAANAARNRVAALLGVARSYDLERLDLTVDSTLDARAQHQSTEALLALHTPEGARAAGLFGHRLLRERDDPAPLRYSFTLFERGDGVNRLRVQTDNFDQPFDLNEGARLDMGSTAKLRTLVSYLELVARLHARWADLEDDELDALDLGPDDALSRWARDHLRHNEARHLGLMLEAAMDRRYPASPAETFFTGGGVHRFGNFDADDDHRTMSVREAFRRSVNLVFVRLMRDVVQHLVYQQPGFHPSVFDEVASPRRQALLARFADQEGRQFIARFYPTYRDRPAEDAETQLLGGRAATPQRLAALYFGLEPDGSPQGLAALMARHRGGPALPAEALERLQAQFGPERLALADRAHLVGVHPLELWTAAHLRADPAAHLREVLAASAEARQAAYDWLFRTRNKAAQDQRIGQVLEQAAFAELHQMWRRVGYPFDTLTASYASALGASGDRPAALAELMGLIANEGLSQPTVRIDGLHFARDTPYETRLARRPPRPERMMEAEVARTVRRALEDVVAEGTARRLHGSLRNAQGQAVVLGGKTGTGDHRYSVHGRDGQVIASRVLNRSASFAFVLGERHYGVLMVYVGGPEAERYRFTSALPTQLLKSLLPTLWPWIDTQPCDPPVQEVPPGDVARAG
jgi:membrane peptidoglycan carboxypeptidase